jgi:uncharacterized protein (TIGR02246 family)
MQTPDDEREITAMFEAADRALMNADLDALSAIFGDEYVQYDPSGRPNTKQEIFASLRTGAVRYPSIVSTGRTVRVFGEMAAVHGSETDEVEQSGRRTSVTYLYLDVLLKRDRRWQIVSSLLAKPTA